MGKLGLVQGLFLLPKVLKSKWNHQKNPESVWTFFCVSFWDVIPFGQPFHCPGVVKPPVFIEFVVTWVPKLRESTNIIDANQNLSTYTYIYIYIIHVQLVWYHIILLINFFGNLLGDDFWALKTMAKTQGQRIAEAEGRWSSAESGTSLESKERTTRKQVKTWNPCILIGCIHLNLYNYCSSVSIFVWAI